MTRFFGLLLIGGVGLIVMGAYGFFIEDDASSTPTTVSIADLEKAVPSNRNLIVTGGRALVNDAVVYYETRRDAKIAGSEAHFVPIQDASLAAYHSLTPPLLLRISEAQMDAIKNGKVFDARAIHGVRMTHWDLEGKARDLQTKRYGEAAVKKMVILEYEKEVTGIGDLGQMFLGAVCIVGAVVCAGLTKQVKDLNVKMQPNECAANRRYASPPGVGRQSGRSLHAPPRLSVPVAEPGRSRLQSGGGTGGVNSSA
jgi:hypothetical protein